MAEPVNYITSAGYRRLREEYEALYAVERPQLLETINWAAGNGDRSENGDYIYGRKRLREVDRRINWLAKRMAAAKVVDPALQEDRTRIFFGAKVLIIPVDDDGDDAWRSITIVGDDEAGAEAWSVGWSAPLARALRGAAVGEVRNVALPAGERAYKIIEISYPG